MQLQVLDYNGSRITYLDTISILWNRRLKESGTFTVQIRKSDYSPNFYFIYTTDRPEIGIINKVKYDDTSEGEFVELTGFFAERLVFDYVVPDTKIFNNKDIIDIVYELYQSSLTYLNGKTTFPVRWDFVKSNSSKVKLTMQQTGGSFGDVAYQILGAYNYGLKASFVNVFNEPLIRVTPWIGVDHSRGTQNPVIFSSDLRNIDSISTTIDDSNLKNYAIVKGAEKADGTRYAVEVDTRASNTEEIKILYVDARDIQLDANTTEAQMMESLRTRGREKLSEYFRVSNYDFEVTQTAFKYLNDYNLGDTCTLDDELTGISLDAVVVGIDEVFEGGHHTISHIFGTKIPTQYERAVQKATSISGTGGGGSGGVGGGVLTFNGRSGDVHPQEGDYTKSMVGLGSVDNIRQYSLNNPPPYSAITGTPSSLPANGGNSDTVDGKHASDLTLKSDFLECTTNTGVFLKDALFVSLSDKNGVYNKPALVSESASIQMPPNCILGVRHVQYVNSQNVGVYIYGKDTQNKANIWGNYYTGGTWTGWESLNGDNIKTGFCQTLENFGSVSVVGFGRISARKVSNTLWLVSGRTSVSRANAFTTEYGLSINNIGNALGLNLYGNADLGVASKATYYNTNGTINTDLTGYGGCFDHINNHYRPSRYYNTSGSVGGWQSTALPEGSYFDFDIYLREV